MNKAIQAKPQSAEVVSVATPQSLIQLAIEKGADFDQLSKLMDLQERHEARQAKSDYLSAVTQFQAIVPRLTKTKQGHKYKYTPLSDIAEQIKDELQQCGLSYRFEMKESDSISVSCVISHINGHSERNTMTAAADTSGSKNGVQAIGSTITYLQRYTLIGALGLTTADEDIDARLPFEGVTEEQQATIQDLLESTGADKTRFLKWAKVDAISGIAKCNYESVVTQIKSTAKAKK